MIFFVLGASEGSEGVVRDVALFVVVREVLGCSWRSKEDGSVRSRVAGAAVSIVEGMFGGMEESSVVIVAGEKVWYNLGLLSTVELKKSTRSRW